MFNRKTGTSMLCGLVASVTLAAFGLLLIFGTAAALADKPQPPPPPPQPPADPAIAFTRSVTERRVTTRYLAVCNADGTNVTNLVALNALLNTGALDRASWAPDGHSIAFSVNASGGVAGIWRIDVSVVNGVPVGSNLLQLATGENFAGVDWSPSGDTIAYADSLRIYTIPAGGGARQLIYGATPSRYPRFSPDGARIAFVYPYSTSYIKVCDLNNFLEVTTVATLVNSMPTTLDWANTSDTLSYIDSYGGQHINLVNVVTGARTVLAPIGSAQFGGASFSPDDSRLVYVPFLGDGSSNLAVYTFATGATTTLPVSGKSPEWRRNP